MFMLYCFLFFQVGLPLHVCKILTYPERVTQYNIEQLRKLILNGSDDYPGARFVEYSNGDKKFLRYARRDQIAHNLKIGTLYLNLFLSLFLICILILMTYYYYYYYQNAYLFLLFRIL